MNLFLQTTFYKQNESNIILKSLNNTFIEGGFSMNLFHLRYFETLARTEHYSKAAEILSITQPSLSYAISTLESELGIQLFEKRGRNIVLTKYGKAFYSNVKEILASLDNAVRDIKLVANGEGEINIGFLRTLGTDYVPTTVKNFLDLHPEQRADLVAHQPVEQTARLLGVDELHVHRARLLDRALDRLFRDLVEFHAAFAFRVDAQNGRQMPRNRLALAVRVRREDDGFRALRLFADALEHLAPAANGDVLRFKIVLDVHAKLGFGQIPNVPLRGLHLVVSA